MTQATAVAIRLAEDKAKATVSVGESNLAKHTFVKQAKMGLSVTVTVTHNMVAGTFVYEARLSSEWHSKRGLSFTPRTITSGNKAKFIEAVKAEVNFWRFLIGSQSQDAKYAPYTGAETFGKDYKADCIVYSDNAPAFYAISSTISVGGGKWGRKEPNVVFGSEE